MPNDPADVIRVCAQLPVGSRQPRATAAALLQFSVSSRGYLFWPDAVSPAVMLEVRQAAAARQVMDRSPRPNPSPSATYTSSVTTPCVYLAERTVAGKPDRNVSRANAQPTNFSSFDVQRRRDASSVGEKRSKSSRGSSPSRSQLSEISVLCVM